MQTRKIIPNKDVEVCGGIREEPLIEVGPDQGRQERGRVPGRCGQGKSLAGRPSKPPELDNVKCRFVPDVQVIRAGPLDVVNKRPGAAQHPRLLRQPHRIQHGVAKPGAANSHGTDRAGTVRVDCDAHGWMEGWIYVVDNPYYAITGADGKFSITDVPPGTYKLVAIQSFTGPIQQSVTVDGGKPTTLTIELKKQ